MKILMMADLIHVELLYILYRLLTKTYLYGPMSQAKVIRKSQSDIYTDIDTVNKAREEDYSYTKT